MMDRFNSNNQPLTSASADLPAYKRSPQRITITVSWRLHQKLLARSGMEGRSLSNLAAHLLETCFPEVIASY